MAIPGDPYGPQLDAYDFGNHLPDYNGQHYLNPVNTTPGAWGVSPYYLTPGYTANLRPKYYNPNQGSGTPASEPGYLESIYRSSPAGVYSGSLPWNANTMAYQAAYTDKAVYGAADASMAGMQSLAPIAAFFAANKLLNRSVQVKANSWTRFKAGAMLWGGAPTTAARGALTSMSLGTSFGYNAGHGLASGLARGLGGRFVSSGVAEGIGAAGGILGMGAMSLGGSLLVGSAISNTLQDAVFDPYIANRNTINALRNNYSNVHFSGDGGSATGFGLSRTTSASIASKLTDLSIRDFSTKTGDYGVVGNLAAQAGLLNDVGGADANKIVRKIKDITSQVKLVMSIANESSLSEAVNTIAKLKMAGATDTNGFAGQMLRQIGQFSAASGISTSQMINTIGAAGQYTAQSMGIAGYVGMREAAKSHALMSSAYRTGSLSDMSLSMMGGMEGASQYNTDASLKLSMDKYNQIRLANQYLYGRTKGGMVNNMTDFGSEFARNPFATQGRMFLHAGRMASAQLMNDPSSITKGIFERMDLMPFSKTKDGKYDAYSYASMLKGMGMSPQEAEAHMTSLASAADPESRNFMLESMQAKATQEEINYRQQRGVYGDNLVGRTMYGVDSFWRNYVRAPGNALVSKATMGASGVGDFVDKAKMSLLYGVNSSEGIRPTLSDNLTADEFLGRHDTGESLKGFKKRSNFLKSFFGAAPVGAYVQFQSDREDYKGIGVEDANSFIESLNTMSASATGNDGMALRSHLSKLTTALKNGDHASAKDAMTRLTTLPGVKDSKAFKSLVSTAGSATSVRTALNNYIDNADAEIAKPGENSEYSKLKRIMEKTSVSQRRVGMTRDDNILQSSPYSGGISDIDMLNKYQVGKYLSNNISDLASARAGSEEQYQNAVEFLKKQGFDVGANSSEADVQAAAVKWIQKEKSGDGSITWFGPSVQDSAGIPLSGDPSKAAGQIAGNFSQFFGKLNPKSKDYKRAMELSEKVRRGGGSAEDYAELAKLSQVSILSGHRSGAYAATSGIEDASSITAMASRDKDTADNERMVMNMSNAASKLDLVTFQKEKAKLEAAAAKTMSNAADKVMQASINMLAASGDSSAKAYVRTSSMGDPK